MPAPTCRLSDFIGAFNGVFIDLIDEVDVVLKNENIKKIQLLIFFVPMVFFLLATDWTYQAFPNTQFKRCVSKVCVMCVRVVFFFFFFFFFFGFVATVSSLQKKFIIIFTYVYNDLLFNLI